MAPLKGRELWFKVQDRGRAFTAGILSSTAMLTLPGTPDADARKPRTISSLLLYLQPTKWCVASLDGLPVRRARPRGWIARSGWP